ncbi:MAG: aminomethyl-transferring glycine dehydrogenase subunit GcvPB [Rhodospirillaceae bacterium]|jgi:glycine dehydrogenase subunit 2|nr:aminomethyl-transferring glycine dehydrogenase subunit GcvPB [Rhodospirillaceae bacterium]MBT4587987.1 aminomethyl-transferring glycine dehydrogenase subunit GcvPB [Rhodospirillaceae bacterium]MBT4939508.1 aminomethyl-transferring glycine dehydrogenase subunit GcvPB [Rhodospirillaceae bacterium]MBT7267096.1 aminomethyl-transferring glycine dehydrogenase subunit GcvPB [Rhodospirillaceae bacterium]
MATLTGNRGLQLEEKLIFEQNSPGMTAVDLPVPQDVKSRLGNTARKKPIGLPGLSEPTVVRHYLRLSQKNFSIDAGFYPLGSCTMKHNPRLNEKMARLAGLADIHPLQPKATVQGAYELMDMTASWLKTLTGMPAIAMSPAAGAHGELCGLMTIRAALEARGDGRKRVLVPESAHGTNPASAYMCGYKVETIPATDQGRVDLAALKAKLDDDVAAIMVTNPNTCGLFEDEIIEMNQAVHEIGGLVYCDGANFNAIVGSVRPGDLGIDAMHLNLHKTFSTPHGGGGPGAGPVVLSEALAAFAPLPFVVHSKDGFELIEQTEDADGAQPYGRMKGFHGQFGVFVRALSYMLSMGSDGLRQASSDAVLNANYLMAELSDILTPSYDGPCMHEVLFDDRFLKDTEVTTLDFAKAMIDEGFHPMTMYFPLVVHGALLMEPTETESKATLDEFIAVIRSLAEKAQTGNAEMFKEAPINTPRRRLDETKAARNPILTWHSRKSNRPEG